MRTRSITGVVAATCLVAGTAAVAAPAVAGAGHAPSAPRTLTTDDTPHPLNVEGDPAFGWFPQDKDPGEIQTAYQVKVSDDDGRTVWDSRKVGSDQQAYVAYDGPDLDPGAAYSWTVRTWDRTDRVSPWAKPAAFETGISDADWAGAQWIQRAPGGAAPVQIVDGRARVTGGDVTLAKNSGSWTDYTVEATVRPRTGGAGIAFRNADRRNGYMWQLSPANGFRAHVQRNGSHTVLATVPVTIVAGQDYRLKIVVAGSTITTFVDGVQVDQRTDTTHTTGGVGFREASNESAEFDDVTVTAADGTVLLTDDFSGDLAKWDVAPPARQADEWTLARKDVALEGRRVVRARAYVAASHTYELWIDGKRVDRGQSFSYPGEGYYQASDVTDLVKGEDEIGVGVLSHWYGSGQGRPAGVPGVLARISIEYSDGSTQDVVTDGTWKVAEGPYVQAGRRNGEGEQIEHLDGVRQAALDGWDEHGFDDSGWADAVVLGAHPAAPFTHLQGQETRIDESTVHAVRMLTAEDGTVVADFGKVIPARPVVHFDDGVAGRVVQMRAGYNLTDTGRVATSTLLTQGTNMAFPYTQVDGAQEFRAFTHLGFRYLEIPAAEEEVTADDVSAVVVHTTVPDGREASFDSDDETLDEVWAMLQRSALYSVQEAFVDTPTREKGQFLGDAANISYATMQGFAERDATQQAIREFLASEKRHWSSNPNDAGRYNAVYPNGDGKRDIPDYTEMFVDWVWRYYQVTGDRALLAEAYPAIQRTAEYVRRHIPASGPTAGLVTNLTGGSGAYQYGIVDWPEPGRFGYDMGTAARTVINALGVEVLRRTADMAEVLDRPAAEAAAYRSATDGLVEAMNSKLRRADGVYVDGLKADGTQSDHAGQHSTSFAVAFDVAPASDLPVLAEHLAGMGMKQGPMTVHRLLQALGKADRPDAVVRLLTNPDDLGFANILAQDGTFTWEAWTLDAGSNHSQSHGWGAQAAVDMTETLLGIRPDGAGASTVRIVPPATGLDRASGSVPTQRGEVALSWERKRHGVRASLEVPVNVTARVELPKVDGASYRAVGNTDARLVGTVGDRVVFEVGSGTTQFVPVPR
ncbi:family 78 glycoside hydrolase catalytic domain [Mumia sp. DW29H23]|uniref:family 78 glycoside hydrolase catalytic domain n=1 Tax=Mumia sp. DW29H23 TaxID=3421241 RepID=UPI003D693008